MSENKTVVFVFGKLGAGKTSLINSVVSATSKVNVYAVFPGKACRERFGAANMAQSENPAAPEETEVFVRTMVTDAIARMPVGSVLLVDGMPRKPSQVRWIFEQSVQIPTLRIAFHMVVADESVRLQRVKDRDENTPGNWALAKARMNSESEGILRVLEEIFLCSRTMGWERAPLDIVDNTQSYSSRCEGAAMELVNGVPICITPERPYELRVAGAGDLYDAPGPEGVEFYDTDINVMMAANTKFSNTTLARLGLNLNSMQVQAHVDSMDAMTEPMQWSRRFVSRAIDELEELLRELPEAWWARDPANVRKARVELIDAWHFMMSAAKSLGMSGDDFAKAYFQKLRVNSRRQSDGYCKRKKVEGDDAHVASYKAD